MEKKNLIKFFPAYFSRLFSCELFAIKEGKKMNTKSQKNDAL
jgi:hypothetical protein